MPKAIIIGGGIAGLTAAVYLSESGIDVEIIEATPKSGGRTYSFLLKNKNTIIDNGQHVLMGCYNYTLDYLTKIDALNFVSFQKKLKIKYIERGGAQFKLEAKGKVYPINLIIGLLKYKVLKLSDRIKILSLLKNILFFNNNKYIDKTVHEWLIANKQSSEAIKLFWEMLVVSVMNTASKNASANLFISTLKKVFFSGNNGSKLVIPNKGLSKVFCDNALQFIEKNKGKIHYSERVIELKYNKNKITEIITNKGIYNNFDFVITAIPFDALIKFYPKVTLMQFNKFFDSSTIVNLHLWLKENNFSEEFYGFIDSKIHWLFNHKTHISLMTSNALEFSKKTKEEIFEIFVSELKAFFPEFSADNICFSKMIKEKKATFVAANNFENIRPKIKSDFKNLIFAGDWTNTGLPSTIESAAKSGKTAYLFVNKLLN